MMQGSSSISVFCGEELIETESENGDKGLLDLELGKRQTYLNFPMGIRSSSRAISMSACRMMSR